MRYLKQLCGIIFSFTFIINANASDKLKVFVSILPQQYFVQQVGGQYVEVEVLVSQGQNPETYEPKPKQMIALSTADLYFEIGVPFEAIWLDKVLQQNKNITVVACCEKLADLEFDEHHHHDHHDHHGHHDDHPADSMMNMDPHIWTNPQKVKQLVTTIADELTKLDKKNGHFYQANAKKFIDKLEELDAYIVATTAGLSKRTLIVAHPAWAYFANQYGFEQRSIEQHGREIQLHSMVDLINFAKRENIRAVFTQPQFSRRGAEVIAKEINAVVLDLDPLAWDYLDNMRTVIDTIYQGLSR